MANEKFLNNSGLSHYDTKIKNYADTKSAQAQSNAQTYADLKLTAKQDKLTASTGIIIDANNEISIDSSYPTQIYVDNKLALKQDKLVSGTNIRTVDGKTLLGSGNIALPTIVGSNWGVAKQGTVTVSGTTASTVSISDLNLTSASDYQVAITPSANLATPPYINKSVASFTVTIANNSGSKTLYYTIFAKGYGSIPAGGSTGQVLTKKSGADGDVEWAAGGGGGGGGTVDQTYDPTSANAQSGVALATPLGDLNSLTTTNKDSLVNAINDVDFAVKNIGEPFRVVNWASNTLNVQIVPCTSEVANTSLAKMIFTIDNETGIEYQIVGMIAYEVFDAASGGNRINCFPVCQFTGNGQKELSVRWMCGGTTNKTAKRINAWVLLKHR